MQKPFSLDKAINGGRVETRCGFVVVKINFDTGIDETPIAAIVLEEISEVNGRWRTKRQRKKHTTTRIEPCMTLYHVDGRLHDDKDDDWDLVIIEES